MKRYCLTLDLKDDAAAIKKYEEHHQKVWPEIIQSITNSGITGMEIFRYSNRLCMIMEVDETFSFERKTAMDSGNEKVAEWEKLMWEFQQPLAGSTPGSKWQLMDKIFDLNKYK